MDVGENTSRRNGDVAQKLVKLLIVLDGKGDVSWDNAALLVVASGIAGKLEDLSAEVLEDGGKVDSSANSDTASISSLLDVSANTGNRELKASLGRGANALSGTTTSLSLSSDGSLSFSSCCGEVK